MPSANGLPTGTDPDHVQGRGGVRPRLQPERLRPLVWARPLGQRPYKDEYARAKKHLSKTKDYAIIQRLEKSKETITLREGTKLTDTAYNPHSKEVEWNPYSALIVPAAASRAPRLGSSMSSIMPTGTSRITKGDYDKEELRVIKGSETRAARQFKESTRTTPNSDAYHLYKVEHSDMR